MLDGSCTGWRTRRGDLPLQLGAAIGGAALNWMWYLHDCDSSGSEPTVGGSLLAIFSGAASGGLGGLAGLVDDVVVKMVCVLGSGLISGIYSGGTSDSFSGGILGFFSGSTSTLFGMAFELNMFVGFNLGTANALYTMFTGFTSELVTRSGISKLLNEFFGIEPSTIRYIPSNGVGGGKEMEAFPLYNASIN